MWHLYAKTRGSTKQHVGYDHTSAEPVVGNTIMVNHMLWKIMKAERLLKDYWSVQVK